MGGGEPDTDGKNGGGGSIDHVDSITFKEFNGDVWYSQADINSDTYYGNCFTNSRQGIFHYLLICDDCSSKGSNWLGRGAWIEDNILLDGKKFSSSSSSKQAKVFMHELGHNLGLAHPDDPADPNGIPDDADTVMRSPYSDSHPLNYHSKEWRCIKISQSLT